MANRRGTLNLEINVSKNTCGANLSAGVSTIGYDFDPTSCSIDKCAHIPKTIDVFHDCDIYVYVLKTIGVLKWLLLRPSMSSDFIFLAMQTRFATNANVPRHVWPKIP